ncbi:MAG: lipoprotein [Gammaproteobacteria bacterium]
MPGRSCGKMIGLLILLFALSQVAACGQKGKLTLPDEQPSSLTTVSIFT